jgi:hypothetical protein
MGLLDWAPSQLMRQQYVCLQPALVKDSPWCGVLGEGGCELLQLCKRALSRPSKSKWPRAASRALTVDVRIAVDAEIATSADWSLGKDTADRKLGEDLTLSKGERNGGGDGSWKDSRGAHAPLRVSAVSKGDTIQPLEGPHKSV